MGGHDKRFKITFKYWFWDKYRELESMAEKKVVEFFKMGEKKHLSAFLTTTMTDILVGEDGVEEKSWLAPFVEISKSPKLSILRQSLLLFLRHFLAVDGAGREDETRLKLIRERIDRVADYLKKK